MKNYPKKTIGELCNIVKGETGIASAIAGEYPLVVTAKDRKTSATYQFDTQAVCIPLVSSSGHGKKSLNYVHYQEGKFALGTILAAVIPKNHDEILASFLNQYLLFYKDTKIVPLMRGAANVSLAVKDIAKIEIPLPPIDEQKDFIVFFNKLQKFNDELVQEFDKQEKYVSQLKQAILEEAIAGQLTVEWRTENPMQKGNPDTDASALLAKIKAEKQQLIADGNLKKEKPRAEIAIDEVPFSIPDSWVWCRLGDTCNYGGSLKAQPNDLTKDTWVLDLEDIESKTSKLIAKVRFSERNSLSTKNIFGKNDVLYSKLRPYLDKVLVADENGVCTTEILPLKFYGTLNPFYMRYALKTNYFLAYVNSVTKGMRMPRLGTKEGQIALIPLPPLAEQKAIVEKVDRLMNIIDQLEQQIKHRKQLAEDLMQTVLREAFE